MRMSSGRRTLTVLAVLIAVTSLTVWPARPAGAAPGVCLEASCSAVTSAYISHFTGPGCTGTESYYTAYFGFDGVRRSWDGHGIVGDMLRTETNRSWKGTNGACHSDWPNGNPLPNMVRVYRIFCPESSCTPVYRNYISHFTGLDCTGTESYYTPYFSSDGLRRSWDGHGIVGDTLFTETNQSWKAPTGVCHNDWPGGLTLSGFVRVYR